MNFLKLSEIHLIDLEILSDYEKKLEKNSQVTFHQLTNNFDNSFKKSINNIKMSDEIMKSIENDFPGCEIIPVDDMNEYYVSVCNMNGSDNIFLTNHLDGPYYLFPFCTLIRALVAICGNPDVKTIFQMDGKEFALEKGDVCYFDYNRDFHYIRKEKRGQNKENFTPPIESETRARILLKLHYAIIPKKFIFLKKTFIKLNTIFQMSSRNLFVKSLQTITLKEKIISFSLNKINVAYCVFVSKIGYKNLFYSIILLCGLFFNASLLFSFCFIPFFIYFLYHFFQNYKSAFFKRDILFFSTLSITIIIYYSFFNKLVLIISLPFFIILSVFLFLIKKFNIKISDELNFNSLLQQFKQHHLNRNNVRVHVFSSLIGLFFLFSIVMNIFTIFKISPYFVIILAILYSIFIHYVSCNINKLVLNISSLAIIGIAYFTLFLNTNIHISIFGFIAAFISQELSHFIYKEKTVASNFLNDGKFIRRYILFSFYLVPLVLDSALKDDITFPGNVCQ